MEILPEESNLVKCACGCGATFTPFNKGGYGPRKFLHGHNPSTMIGKPCQDLPNERWQVVPGFDRYEASDLGRIRNRRTGALITPKPNAVNNYLYVSFRIGQRTKGMTVHRVILLTFIGPANPGQQCRHLNGNRQDCRLGNLAWGTRIENSEDQLRHGTRVMGERVGSSRLKNEDVIYIRSLPRSTNHAELAAKFGVAKRTIRDVVNGITWRHLLSPMIA